MGGDRLRHVSSPWPRPSFSGSTPAGHRFIVDKINAMKPRPASGPVGRIEGSIFGRLTVHDLSLADPRGTFASAPRAELDYRPSPI